MILRPDRRHSFYLAALALATALATPADAGSIKRNYTLTNLGELGSFEVGGISNAGDIVATAWNGNNRVIRYREGVVTPLTPDNVPGNDRPWVAYHSPRISSGGNSVLYNYHSLGFDASDSRLGATVMTGGVSTNLDAPPGPDDRVSVIITTGVNDRGEVIGGSASVSSDGWQVEDEKNFLLTDRFGGGRQKIDLGSFSPSAINNQGQMAGVVEVAPGTHQAALADVSEGATSQTLLGTLGGRNSHANAINDRGQVVGASNVPDSEAFLPDFLQFEPMPLNEFPEAPGMPPPGELGGPIVGGGPMPPPPGDGEGYGPPPDDWGGPPPGDDWGGPPPGDWSPADDVMHAFLYEDGQMRDLGTLPGHYYSEALAVNNLGQVVGYSLDPYSPGTAFLYEDGVMIDLNDLLPDDSGWTLERAIGINDLGQIIGQGFFTRDGDILPPEIWEQIHEALLAGEYLDPSDLGYDMGVFEQRSFLLTPEPVPEPSTFAVLALAGAGLLIRHLRRRR